MGKEQMKILEMLETGKIKAEEAARLLESLKVVPAPSGEPAVYEQDFEETVSVREEASIDLAHSHGQITVQGWDKEEIQIKGTKIVRAIDLETAQMFAEQMRVEVASDQRRVTVRTHRPEAEAAWRIQNITINYELLAPHRFSAAVQNRHGRTCIAHFAGTLAVNNQHGDLHIEEIGDTLTVQHEHGHIDIAQIEGDADVRKSHGDLRMKSVSGTLNFRHEHGHAFLEKIGRAIEGIKRHGNAEIRDTGGEVRLEQEHGHLQLHRTGGNAEIEKRHGNAEVEDVQGGLRLSSQDGHAEIRGIDGDVHLRGARGNVSAEAVSGAVDIVYAHGAVRLRSIRDGVTVHNRQGHIEVTAPHPVTHPYRLRAEHGNIMLIIPEEAGIDLSAQTEHGRIQSDMPLSISKKGHLESAEESRHGGGIAFDLSGRHGHIQIERCSKAPAMQT